MFTAILSRNKGIHIINWRFVGGSYRTMCGKTFSIYKRLNTLSFDNTFDGLCKNCKIYFDACYLADLQDFPEMSRSTTQQRYDSLLDFHRNEVIGPKLKFENISNRFWSKLTGYQKIILRNKKHE